MSTEPPQVWRWLDLDRQGPYENAAVMPVLVRSVAESSQPIAQTSVWGETHLNVGWFDDVDSTLDLARCDALGIPVIRRSFYGGGTAYYQAECSMMWGFLLPKGPDTDDLDGLLVHHQRIFSSALDSIGLGDIRFEGSSDLRWRDRKLGALTAQDVVACISIGGFINLRRPDLSTYLEVVRIPDDKFKDKAVKDMTEYVCTAEEVAGTPITYEQLRDALVSSLAAAGIELIPDSLNAGELKGFAKLAERVRSPESIRRLSSEQFRKDAPPDTTVAFGNHKGRKLCRAGVAIDQDGSIAAAFMAGDMHASPPDVLESVSAALEGAQCDDPNDLRDRIASVWDGGTVNQADDTMGVTTDDLLAAVLKAVDATGSP